MAIGILPESVLREVERAALVRSAVGPHVRLMADVNELWSVGRAIDIGRRTSRRLDCTASRARPAATTAWRSFWRTRKDVNRLSTIARFGR